MAKKHKRPFNRPSPAIPAARTEFNPDYTHVKRDLTRIGILAGSFFVILIVLSFFLR
jgi:hypothetical protein